MSTIRTVPLARGGGVLLLSSLLLGSTCSPSEPGCEYPGSCVETAETRSCVNFCVPVYSGPVVETVYCALDDCDAALLNQEGIWRCPVTSEAGQSYRCAYSLDTEEPGRIGVCRLARTVLEACVPGADDRCESNTFCLDINACPDEAAPATNVGLAPLAQGFCALPAREGEACTGDLGRSEEPGCRPCEWGTWCRDTPEFGKRCVRSCESQSGEPDPGLCGCSREGEGCETWEDWEIGEPAEGEPTYYCSLVDIPNGGRCSEVDGPPCEDVAAECQPVSDPLRGAIDVCCVPDEGPCTVDSDCCPGRSVCLSGACSACGQDGDDPPAAGCCPGFAPVDGLCRSCSSSREGRDPANLVSASCEGDYVQLENEDIQRETFAVPLGGSTGAGRAEMPLTTARTQIVRYQVPDTHRVFLLEGDLTGTWSRAPGMGQHPPTYQASSAGPWPQAGITVGHQFVLLPGVPSGGGPNVVNTAAITDPMGMAVPTSTWESLRVYDAGSCSSFRQWGDLTDLLVASINVFLTVPQFGIFGSDPLTLLGPTDDPNLDQRSHVTPILASGTGMLGRSSDQDQVGLFVGYQARGGEGFECPEATLWFSAGFRVLRDAAIAPTVASEDLDRELTVWHDFINEGDFCVDGDCVSWCRGAGECRELCSTDGDEYECHFWVEALATSYGHREPRPVRVLRDAFDYRPELVYLDGGVVGCGNSGLNDFLTGLVAGRIQQFLPGVLSQLTGQFTVRLPSAGLGVAFEDLAECGRTLPGGQVVPSDGTCAAVPAPLFGNRRMRCVGFDAEQDRTSAPELVASYRCADVIPEVRRINLRPDGAEIVLADSTADPQHPLVNTFLGNLCDPQRGGSAPAPGPIVADTVARGYGLLSALGLPARRICHPDDDLTPRPTGGFFGCGGMCGDRGMPCDPLFRPGLPPGSECYSTFTEPNVDRSFCCHPDNFCALPASAGGLRFFDDPVAPTDPPAFWNCVDLNTNELACGSCGTACGAGELCCGSTCLDPTSSSSHCGECGNACAGGAPCLSGVCCAAGETICAGACTNTDTHPGHCGSCGNVCGVGQSCSLGVCCPTGQTSCGGTCRDLSSDPSNCGACLNTCSFSQLCTNGTCCTPPTEDCDADGLCDDMQIDPDNCGSCGNACGFGSACISGNCV